MARRTTTALRVDLGPAIRRERGEVVTEFRPDPDNPQAGTVKGARAAQGGHDYLHRRGAIDDVQHAAACRYYDGVQGHSRSGCTLAAAMDGAGRTPPHQQGHPALCMVDAAAMIRHADEILGPGQTALVRMVVIEGKTLAVIGEASGEGDQGARFRLRAALDRLAELWGIE